jgi:hypothetical protein
VDVEGFENDVFKGTHGLWDADLLGIQTETNFDTSPVYPTGHSAALHYTLLTHHFKLFDAAFDRVPREAFQQALVRKGLPMVVDQSAVEKIFSVNALFLRDMVQEAESPQNYLTPPRAVSVDKLLKAMIIYELHGLNDIALDTAVRFRGQLGQRINVDHAIELLAVRDCRRNDVSQRVIELGQRADELR